MQQSKTLTTVVKNELKTLIKITIAITLTLDQKSSISNKQASSSTVKTSQCYKTTIC